MEPADVAAAEAGPKRPGPDGCADSLYGTGKAHLRPIHDAIVTLAEGLGNADEDDLRSLGPLLEAAYSQNG